MDVTVVDITMCSEQHAELGEVLSTQSYVVMNSVGIKVGTSEGVSVGALGTNVGVSDGPVGSMVGTTVGTRLGCIVGVITNTEQLPNFPAYVFVIGTYTK